MTENDFTLEDVAGKDFLLPILRSAFREVESSLREAHPDGGQLVDYQLQDAVKGMLRTAKMFGESCSTESAARAANAERALYEVGLVSAGVSPVTVSTPKKYRD